jgi:crotonobetainyl-CoA:carnitine CoA-transferase CaiB-like acyl-CoA transferase
MAEWTAERTTAEALKELESARVPAGPLYSPQQALEDAHIRAAGLLHDTDYPGLPRPAPLAPTPVDLSETPGRFRHPYYVYGPWQAIQEPGAARFYRPYGYGWRPWGYW